MVMEPDRKYSLHMAMLRGALDQAQQEVMPSKQFQQLQELVLGETVEAFR